MRKLSTYMFLLCCLMHISASGQEQAMALPEDPGESLSLMSDRDIYGTGEKIHYSASYGAPAGLKGGLWSSVLYVELISWDGTKLAGSKVLIQNNGAAGALGIPRNISSGVYYLRAYTKWMRNYSPDIYAYLPLRILNPYSQEMLASPAEGNKNRLSIEHVAESQAEGIEISGLKDQYGTGEQVEIGIKIPGDLGPGQYSVGIAKTPAQSSLEYILSLIHI